MDELEVKRVREKNGNRFIIVCQQVFACVKLFLFDQTLCETHFLRIEQ